MYATTDDLNYMPSDKSKVSKNDILYKEYVSDMDASKTKDIAGITKS